MCLLHRKGWCSKIIESPLSLEIQGTSHVTCGQGSKWQVLNSYWSALMITSLNPEKVIIPCALVLSVYPNGFRHTTTSWPSMDVIPGFGSTVRLQTQVFLWILRNCIDLSPQKTLAEAKTAHRWYLPAPDITIRQWPPKGSALDAPSVTLLFLNARCLVSHIFVVNRLVSTPWLRVWFPGGHDVLIFTFFSAEISNMILFNYRNETHGWWLCLIDIHSVWIFNWYEYHMSHALQMRFRDSYDFVEKPHSVPYRGM